MDFSEVSGSANPGIVFDGLDSGKEYEITVSYRENSASSDMNTGTAASTTSEWTITIERHH